jgi:hypothetical protein
MHPTIVFVAGARRTVGRVLEPLAGAPGRESGVPFTVFRPSAFLDREAESR